METKPGYRSTEFIITALTNVGVIITALAATLPERHAVIALGVVNAAYAVARGLAKLGQPYNPEA